MSLYVVDLYFVNLIYCKIVSTFHHSSFIIHHSSFIIHHSSFIIHHSSNGSDSYHICKDTRSGDIGTSTSTLYDERLLAVSLCVEQYDVIASF